MKRYAIGLALFAIMTVWLSGCILSHSPSTAAVTIKVGDPQTFAVTGVLNGTYTWYLNDTPIDGATSASYTYKAVLADLGTNKLTVSTTDKLNGKTLSFQWTVTVVNDLPPIADAGIDQNVTFGTPVLLDGSASTDPEGEPLTYVWEIVGRPAGSACALDNPNAVSPVFNPDVQGVYTIALIVNDGRLTSDPDIVIIKSYKDQEPPTANAGEDQGVVFGNVVQLDGSDSIGSDLTYQWKIDSGPAGSAAFLDDPTKQKPNLIYDKKGVYVVSLVVNNGVFNSGIDLAVITIYNNTPVANAGADQTVATLGGTATLDGSASADPDGTALTYAWTITSRPYGSIAQLGDATAAQPTFNPDKKGAYSMQLVVNDGELSSSPDTVIVTCSNQVPVANAGAPINIPFGAMAHLNGSATDPDGDPMTYAWTETGKPAGSTAALSNAAILNPTFTPDVQGTYTFALVATDNTGLASAPATVTVSTENHQPVADAGADVIMPSNSSVALDGTGSSDIDGDLLNYTWRVITAPMGSGGDSTLSDLHAAKPVFTPDKKGDYQLGLIVNDGQADSLEATLKIHVINNQPVANPGPSRDVHYYNRFVTLDGTGSYDIDGDPLTYSWRIISKPAGSTATLTNATTAYPSITVDVPQGTWVIGLTVNDGYIDSAEVQVNINYIEHQPVANAGPAQSKHSPLTFQLDGSGSSDEDGDPLSYTWRVISRPSGSTAALSSTNIVNPTITADKLGAYMIGLTVNDGLMNSATESTVTLTLTNNTPVANAGSSQSTHWRYGTTAPTFQLDGSGSSDGDNDTLTYTWTLKSAPSGSTAALTNRFIANPTITADKIGTYTFGLVVSDAWSNSTESTVTVTVTNATPVANAGSPQNSHTNLTFQLNGIGSSDGDSDPLSYTWTLKSTPSGSTAALSNRYIMNPTITADKPGAYVIGLVVNDGWVSSNESTVTITFTNSAPVANAGIYADVTYTNRNNVQLNGGGSSDPDGDTLTYTWTLTSKPSGSAAVLSSTTIFNPTFNMDLPGTYSFSLVVNDGWLNSSASTTSVASSMGTLTTTWEDGLMSPWYVIATSGTQGSYGVSTDQANSGSRSFKSQSGSGTGTFKWGRNINAYVTTMTFYGMNPWTNSSPNVDLYENNTKLQDIGNSNSWTQRSQAFNHYVSGYIAFLDNLSYSLVGRKWYVDDIVINIWNN